MERGRKRCKEGRREEGGVVGRDAGGWMDLLCMGFGMERSGALVGGARCSESYPLAVSSASPSSLAGQFLRVSVSILQWDDGRMDGVGNVCSIFAGI